MLSLFELGVHAPERLIPVARIRDLLRQPGGVTMTFLVESLREPRDIVSNDLETMRDCLGFPVRWDPDTGTYRLGSRLSRPLGSGHRDVSPRRKA